MVLNPADDFDPHLGAGVPLGLPRGEAGDVASYPGGLQLDPDFQRAHVWDRQKQVAYVEYVLRGGKFSKDLYFNCADWNGYKTQPIVLVDGKQRLQAVRLFMAGELEVFGNLTIDCFEGRLPHYYCFTLNMNDLKTREEVLTWYLDINSGGVVHTAEELEKVRQLLREEQSKA